MTTNYMMNEFLSEQDKRIYEIMKERNPRRYKIEGLGEWGIAEGLIYTNWKEEEFDIDEILQKYANDKTAGGLPALVSVNGVDFGYNDPTAFVGAYADRKRYKIYIYFEYNDPQFLEGRQPKKMLVDY